MTFTHYVFDSSEPSPSYGRASPSDQAPKPQQDTEPGPLDEEFVRFMLRYVQGDEIDPRLQRYISLGNMLDYRGDPEARMNELFTRKIGEWIGDGSELKDKLKEYPDVYNRYFPGENPAPSESQTPVSASDGTPQEQHASDEHTVPLKPRPGAMHEVPVHTATDGSELKRKREEEQFFLTKENRPAHNPFGPDPKPEIGADQSDSGPGTEAKRRRPWPPGPTAESVSGDSTDQANGDGDGSIYYDADFDTPAQEEDQERYSYPEQQPAGSEKSSISDRVFTTPTGDQSGTGEEESPWGPPPPRTHDGRHSPDAVAEMPVPGDTSGMTTPPGSRPNTDDEYEQPISPTAPVPDPSFSSTTRRRSKSATEQHSIPLPGHTPTLPDPPQTSSPPPSEPAFDYVDYGADDSIPQPPAEDVDEDELERGVTQLSRRGWEWEKDMVYEGRRHPPLAVRIEQALNFLREEDCDRRIGWERMLADVEKFVDAMIDDNPESYLQRCSAEVYEMFRDLQSKCKVHRLFEQEKKETIPWGQGIQSVEEVPLPKRGKRMGKWWDRGLMPAPTVEDIARERKILVVEPQQVNMQFAGRKAASAALRERLAEAGEAFWQDNGARVYENGETPDDYLYRVENTAYEACIAIGGPLSKFRTLDGTGDLAIPDEDWLLPVPAGETESEKRLRIDVEDRGSIRAALQQSLRYFSNTEQALATTKWSRVVPQVEQVYLEEIRRDLDRNWQWEKPQVDWSKMPRLETMPYTLRWKQHREFLTRLNEEARQEVEKLRGNNRGWVTLPKNITCGGPYVWRMVDPDVQAEQDLLKECEQVFDALMRARFPQSEAMDRLKGVCKAAAEGKLGHSGNEGEYRSSVERGLESGSHAWDRGTIKSLTMDELKWLRFVAGRSINPEMLTPVEGSNFKLYSIFAKRLEKAMDARVVNSHGLDFDAGVTIEKLLDHINKGSDWSRNRVMFTPFQARYFLERAQEQGLCEYQEDLKTYGIVRYPVLTCGPPQRVCPPAAGDEDEEPEYQFSIVPYKDLDQETLEGNTPLHNAFETFFTTLALRLGLTVYRLRQAEKTWAEAKPLSTNLFRSALSAYEDHKAEISKNYSPDELSIATAVKEADLPAYNYMFGNRYPDDRVPEPHFSVLREKSALNEIRLNVISEANVNKPMLGPGRRRDFTELGSTRTVYVRDHNWDWASVATRGEKKQFFSLDRWPLELQSEETARWIRGDEDVDESMVANPWAEDLVPQRCFRAKLRPYVEQRVRHRPGTPVYPAGDTALQRRMVRWRVEDMVAKATGIKVERPRTWRARLADLLPPLRRRLASPDDDVPDLPEVDPSRVPKSFEPGRKTKAKPKAKRKAKRAVKPAVKPPAPAPVVVPVEHQVAPDPTRDVPRPSIEDQGDVQMGGV